MNTGSVLESFVFEMTVPVCRVFDTGVQRASCRYRHISFGEFSA